MRAKMPTMEELDAILKHPAVENLETLSWGNEILHRVRKFTIRGQQYEIIWHCNAMSVHIGEAEVYTDGLTVDGFWPNAFKLNLNFTTNGETSLVIPLEEYKK